MGSSRLRRRIAPALACVIALGLVMAGSAAGAKHAHRQRVGYTYQIVGELSEADILLLWPPARSAYHGSVESASGRRFFRAPRAGSLADWIPEEALPRVGERLTKDEERVKLRVDMKDRDGDGTPDKIDVYPWDPTRW
jgi:hypothetical protein